MSDNLILEHLKALRNDVSDLRTEVRGRMGNLELRMTAMEQHMATITVSLPGLPDRLGNSFD